MITQDVIADLMANCRAYTALMRAAVRLQLQIKAHERSAKKWHALEEDLLIEMFTQGVTPHLEEALEVLLHGRRSDAGTRGRGGKGYFEKAIERAAQQLPIWPWAEKIRGLGPKGVGLMIGEIGDPGAYANPAKLWKRMGLAVFDGQAQRRVKGEGGILQGFSPQRRALMHVIGDALIKQNTRPDGTDGLYRQLYVSRKALEVVKAPDLALIVHHKRALRYMEKRLLVHLWQAWRTACPGGT